jgi:hypothetical protein
MEVRLHAGGHPAQSIQKQQNPENPRDIAGPINQVTEQSKMNPKDGQAYGPIIAKRTQQELNLVWSFPEQLASALVLRSSNT